MNIWYLDKFLIKIIDIILGYYIQYNKFLYNFM